MEAFPRERATGRVNVRIMRVLLVTDLLDELRMYDGVVEQGPAG